MNNLNLQDIYESPAADIHESEKDICMFLEMPGIAKENINVEFGQDELTISGKKSATEECCGQQHILFKERGAGNYYRKFKLNVNIDKDKTEADYKDGILKITMPKSEELKSKKIEIK